MTVDDVNKTLQNSIDVQNEFIAVSGADEASHFQKSPTVSRLKHAFNSGSRGFGMGADPDHTHEHG